MIYLRDTDDWQGSYPDFTEDEMQCKGYAKGVCNCLGVLPKHSFMLNLVKLRRAVGPLSITSGARCEVYNALVSTTGKNGPHVQGLAADIACYSEKTLKILEEALKLPFMGFGLDQKGKSRYIHLDMVERLSKAIWTY